VGDPAGRLTVKVKNGETVKFTVTENTHGVIFENAVAEQAAGVWKVTAGPQMLKEITLPPYYIAAQARGTDRVSGDILTIKVEGLQSGHPILFGCNPHSKPTMNVNVPMLGAIVLDDGEPVAGGSGVEAFARLPAATTCKRIDFDKAELRPGIVKPRFWSCVGRRRART
jgi:plastocyanin